MKKKSGKAKEFFTKLRQIYGRLIASETKSENPLEDNGRFRTKAIDQLTGGKSIITSRLVTRVFVLVFSFTMVILGGLVWYTWRSNRHLKTLETTHFRLLQLSGQIIHIDEVLTMSAHMAVETGELQWEGRYRNYEPQLDSAIGEVIELSPEQFMKEAISLIDTANIKLVALENRAFDLIRQGDRQTASKLLHSTEYTKQKQVYSNGINEISNAICSLEEARLKEEQRIALTVIVLLIVTMPLVAFIWFAALRILKRYIVGRKRAELALRMAEQRFRAIADYTYFWEVWVSPGGNPLWTNPAVERVTGYSADELMAMRDYPMALIYEDDREKVDKAFKSALKGSTGREMEFRLLRKDGSIVWVETAWQPIFDEKGVSQGHRVSIHDIMDRRQAEEALLESEQRFRDFFENAPIGFHILGPDQIIIDINDAELKMIGYSKKAIVGKNTWAELIVPQQRDMFRKHWHNITTKRHVRNLEYTLVHKDGHHINVILNASARFDKDGNVSNTRGSVLDITDRKNAMENLRVSEANYHSILDSVNDAIFVHDIENGRILSVNQKACEMFGYTRKVFEKLTVGDLSFTAQPYDQEHAMQWIKKAAKEGPQLFEWICKHKTGQNFWAEINLKLAVIEGENRMLAILRDITKRRQTEEQIKALSRFPSENPNPVLRISAEGVLLYANQSSSKLLALWEIAEKESVSTEIYDIVADVLASRQNKQIDVECGERKCIFSLTFAPVAEMNYVNVYALDITKRILAERSLSESEEEYRTFIESSHDFIFSKDVYGHYQTLNLKTAIGLGASYIEEVIGKTDYEFLPKEQADALRKNDREVMDGGKDIEVEEVVEVGKKKLYALSHKWPKYEKQGKISGIRCFAMDITERKYAERARYKLTRELEAKNKELESILYAVSHDLRSPLVNIQGFSYELAQSCELVRSTLAGEGKTADTEKVMETALSEDIPKALDYVLASSEKMDALLSGLLDISRLDAVAISVRPIDVNAMMANVIENMKYQITKAGAKCDIESLPACLGDISQIDRVFTNLLTNALKFLDKSRPGKIHIFAQSRNDYSVYCVEENGIGIAPEHQGKIFEIFYQLEPDKRKGDGLGLTIARRIIDRQNGRIWVKSEVGKGTKFFVALPNV